MAKQQPQTIAEFARELQLTPAHVGRVIKRLNMELGTDPNDKRRRLIPTAPKIRAKLVAECLKNVQPISDAAPAPTAAIDGEIVEIEYGGMGQLIKVDFGTYSQDGAIDAITKDVAYLFQESEQTIDRFSADYLRRQRDRGRRLAVDGLQQFAAGLQEGEAAALGKQQQQRPSAAQTYSPAS